MIKDTSFQHIKKYKKYKDIFNLKSIEVIVSLLSSVFLVAIILIVVNDLNYDDINNLIRTLTKDIAIALIGLLGFIVTGLAILTSAISNKLMNIVYHKKKVHVIEKILLSFYFLGLVIGVTILLDFILYIISFLNVKVNIILLSIVAFISAYLVIFILFYSIALIGNCVQIFNMINIPIHEDSELRKEDRQLFDSFRVSALERIVFISDSLSGAEKVEEYKKIMTILIEDLNDEEQKKILKTYLDYHLGEN